MSVYPWLKKGERVPRMQELAMASLLTCFALDQYFQLVVWLFHPYLILIHRPNRTSRPWPPILPMPRGIPR